MFTRFTPYFSTDGDTFSGNPFTSTQSDGWGDALRSAADDAPADDEQTSDELDSDAEGEEVTDDGEETPADEPEQEGEQTDDDPDIDMGEGRQAVKLSELKSGFLRQADYTKKTQELATQRKEVEAQAEQLKPIGEWLNHIEQNPWLWGQINQAIEQFNQTGDFPIEEVLQDAQYGQYVNKLLAENRRIQGELDRVNGEYEGVKLTGEMTKLRNDLATEYGDLVTDDYMQQLQERAKAEKLSTATLKEIADGHLAKQAMQSSKKTTKQAEAKAAQKIAETRSKAPEAPKAPAAKPTGDSNDYSNMSWLDALKAASKR